MQDETRWANTLREISDAVAAYRATHQGKVPAEVFEALFPIVGQYESFGAIVLVGEDQFAFVQRDAAMGAHWEGKFQLPCMAVRPDEDDAALLDRLLISEMGVAAADLPMWRRRATLLPGRTVQFEPERQTRCRTRRCLIKVDDISTLPGEWRVLSRTDLHEYATAYISSEATSYEVIDHMVAACLWYLDPDRAVAPLADVDVRKYISSMYDPYPLAG